MYIIKFVLNLRRKLFEKKNMSLKESCVECVNFEIRSNSLTLEHSDPKDFIQAQWPFSQKVYIGYRIFVAAGFICWFVTDIIYETSSFFKDHPYTYLIYATNWSFMLLTFTALYTAASTLYYSAKYRDSLDAQTFERMPWSLKGQWLLKNLSYNSAIVVTVSYWSYIAVLDNSVVLQTTSSHIKHSMNTAYVILDMLISGSPIRVLHLLYTVCLGSVYALFNAIYFLNDGTILEGRHYAYNLLDWGKPSEALVTSVLCVVLCIFAQVILYELYRIRTCVYTKLYFGSDSISRSDSELQRIMAESDVPAYHTISERDDGETMAGTHEFISQQ